MAETSMATMSKTISPWTDWDSKMRFADQLQKTGFLPKAVDTPGKALAIIFAGQELGIPPMQALRSINVIQGKPSLAAELQLALFKQRGGRAKWIRSDDEVAEIWLRHPNGDEHTETFTMEDAKRAKLVHKDGWQFYPKAMLRARAISAGLRAVAPDIIAGIYDPEELGADYGGRRDRGARRRAGAVEVLRWDRAIRRAGERRDQGSPAHRMDQGHRCRADREGA